MSVNKSSFSWYGGKWIKAITEGTQDALREVARKIVNQAQRNFRARVAGSSSKLEQSIGYSLQKDRIHKAFIGIKTNTPAAKYANFVERGRKAGKAPPVGSLDSWVVRVLRVSAKKAKGLAYVIGQKIAKYGVKPKWFLRDAFRDYKDEFTRLHRKGVVERIPK